MPENSFLKIDRISDIYPSSTPALYDINRKHLLLKSPPQADLPAELPGDIKGSISRIFCDFNRNTSGVNSGRFPRSNSRLIRTN